MCAYLPIPSQYVCSPTLTVCVCVFTHILRLSMCAQPHYTSLYVYSSTLTVSVCFIHSPLPSLYVCSQTSYDSVCELTHYLTTHYVCSPFFRKLSFGKNAQRYVWKWMKCVCVFQHATSFYRTSDSVVLI